MSIESYRQQHLSPESQLQRDALRPRPVFLLAALLFAGLAIGSYVYEAVFLGGGDDVPPSVGENVRFIIMLAGLVLCSIFCIFCYRKPQLGNRLLGFGGLLEPQTTHVPDQTKGVNVSGGFRQEGGLSVKHQNSARKRARHSRKALAAATRAMQSEKMLSANGERVSEQDDLKASE